MQLTLTRTYTPTSTEGVLERDGEYQCLTLEDAKDGSPPCIVPGRYEIAITWSDRFQRPMPLLLHVPGRSGIRIHSGNATADTSGCILVGRVNFGDGLGDSRLAYADLFYALSKAIKQEKIWLTIQGSQAAPS